MASETAEIFLGTQQYVGIKVEANAGVAETLTTTGMTSDFRYLIEKPKLTLKFNENQRKYAIGDPFPFQSVMGARSAEFSGTMHIQGSGSGTVYPAHYTLFQAAAFQEVTVANEYKGVVLGLPSKSLTIWIEEKANAATGIVGKRYELKGGGATKFTEHWDAAGKLQQVDFSITAALWQIIDLSAGTNSTPYLTADLSLPPAVLGITCNFTPTGGGAYLLPTNTMTIDYAPKCKLIEWPQDPTGYAYAPVTDFDPVINIKPFIQLEASIGWYDDLSSATPTPGVFTTTLGSGTDGDQIVVQANNVQVVKGLDLEDRDGIDSTTIMFRVLRTAAPSDGTSADAPAIIHYMPIPPA